MPFSKDKQINISHLSSIIVRLGTIDFALVFGSASSGIVEAGSDLDLAAWFTESSTFKTEPYTDCVGQIEEAFGVTCDLSVLNTANVVLRHEALRGKVLYIRPSGEGLYTEFYTKTCAEYEDLMFWRTRQLAYRGYA